jgi:hypothetical protein
VSSVRVRDSRIAAGVVVGLLLLTACSTKPRTTTVPSAQFTAMTPLTGKVWVYDLSVQGDSGRCTLVDEFLRFYIEQGGASMHAGSRKTQRAVPAKITRARRDNDRVILDVEGRGVVEIRLLKDGTIGMRRGGANASSERRLAPCPLRRREGPTS